MLGKCQLTASGILALAAILAGCTTRPAEPPTRPRDNGFLKMAKFAYVLTNPDGAELVRGVLLLPWPIEPGQTVRGTWEAKYVGPVTATQPRPDLNEIGPQIGSGTFAAERENQQIRINLNPNMSDNNVLLIGQIQEGSLAGRWEYSTFTGTRSGGIFRAKPDPD